MRRAVLLSAVAALTLVAPITAFTPPAAAASTTVGVQLAELEPVNDGGGLGWRTAMSADGSVVVAGSHYETVGTNAHQGAAYVFRDTGSAWQRTQLLEPDGGADLQFGVAVAMDGSGTTLAVSSRYGFDDMGDVHVFQYTDGAWVPQQRLTSPDPQANEEFGWALAMSDDGSTLLVTAPWREVPSNADPSYPHYWGAGYVYTLDAGTWVQTAELHGSVPWYELGISAALDADGDTALLGSGGWDDGYAYLFRATGGTWELVQRFQSDDPDGVLAGGDNDVALNDAGNVAVVGDWDGKGEVHVFRDAGTTWSSYDRTVLPKPDDLSGAYGWAIDLDGAGDMLVVSDHRLDEGRGAAYVWSYDGSNWSLHARLVSDPRTSNAYFGEGVAVSGDASRVAIGADGLAVGSVFVFEFGTADISEPGAPVNAQASLDGITGAKVTWEAPTSDGGAPILRYRVTSTPATTTRFAYPSSTDPLEVTFTTSTLTPGASYTFTVVAENVVGPGPGTTTSSLTMLTVPSAPQNVTAVAGDAKATVSWTAPASDGGTPVTSYEITASPPLTNQPIVATSPAVITDLANGTAYTFFVRARNAIGISPGGVATAVTPEALVASITEVDGNKFAMTVTFVASGAGTETCALTITDVKTGVVEASSSSCTSPVTVTDLAGGNKSVELTVTDAFGDFVTDVYNAEGSSKVKGKPLPHDK